MGTPDFAVPILQALIRKDYEIVLVVTQPDRPKGRKKILTPPPVKVEAEKQNIPVFQPEKLKDEYEHVLAYHPDLIITAAYGQILPKALLDGPVCGCINVHASLLSELRGGAPIHHAIIQGKKKTGATIMYMVDKLYVGDMLSQRKVANDEKDNVSRLHDKLAKTGADLLLETLPRLFQNAIVPQQQDESKATFAANLTRDDEKIDWSKSHEAVYNHIRGLNPWPVAFTLYEGQPMKIWWGEKENVKYDASPGEIVYVTDDAFTVACGNGYGIQITEIQPAGKKKMTVGDFLRGDRSRLKPGMKLGD